MNDYAILDGHEVVVCDNFKDWSRRNTGADRTVAKTDVGGAHVSTVFLGCDYSFGEAPPLWFETMVFGDSPLADEQVHYTTWDEAEAGHAAMVERVKAAAMEAKD